MTAQPVLVTGGAGYIGSHTVRALQERGDNVVVLDNLSTGHREAVTAPLEAVDLANCDELAAVFAKHKPRSVIHFAAKAYVGESVDRPDIYYRENVVHTLHLLEAMRAAECRDIVFSSTCATYGEPTKLPISEDHPQNPINPYGRTKLHMEHMMQDFSHAFGLRTVALRYFNAAGAQSDGSLGEDHRPESHLIPLVLQVALKQREQILLFGNDYDTRDGTCERDYIHVEDLADAHLRALDHLGDGGGNLVVNLGTGTGYTVQEVVDIAREVTGRTITATMAPRRPGDPGKLVSGGHGLELLGWSPTRSDLKTILSDAWRWHSARPNGYA